MDCLDYVIIGSGPAGVAAARQLKGKNACIIDVGDLPKHEFPYTSLQAALMAGDSHTILGEKWEMLANLVEPNRVHPKLRAAGLQFVMSGEAFQIRNKSGKVILRSNGSYARGGMSNAWGAQLLRFTDADLEEVGGWPFGTSELKHYYHDLEDHIGIAGQVDDMHEFLGNSSMLLPPVASVPAADHLYSSYLSRKSNDNSKGLLLGRPRIAITTKPFRGCDEYSYSETEFFTSGQTGLYTAQRTLDELLTTRDISYLGQHKLLAYSETSEHVELELHDLKNDTKKKVYTRHLFLGCGTIQTAKLVLHNNQENKQSLPFIDHPPTLLPIFIPSMFGSSLPTNSFPTQLIGTLADKGQHNMISFYYPGALLRSDLLPDIPIPMNAALKILGSLLGGMLVAQIWEASTPSPNNRLSLNEDGEVVIDYPDWHEYTPA